MPKSEIKKQRQALNKVRRAEADDPITVRYVKGVRSLLKLYDEGDRRPELFKMLREQSTELEKHRRAKRKQEG